MRGLGVLSGWGRGAAALPEDARGRGGGTPGGFPRPPRRATATAWRRTTREGLLAVAAVEAALDDAGARPAAIAGERTALVYVTAAAYGASNRRFIEGRGGSIRFAETAPGRRARRGGHRARRVAAPTPSSSAVRPRRSGPSSMRRSCSSPARATARWCWPSRSSRNARTSTRARRSIDRPAAGRGRRPASGSSPGAARSVSSPARGGAGPTAALRRRLGETFSVEPLAALDFWRRSATRGTLELAARWRGRSTRLVWTGASLELQPCVGGRVMTKEILDDLKTIIVERLRFDPAAPPR